jgi:hypothetical protein
MSAYKSQLFFSVAAIVVAIAVYVGFITVDRYAPIVRGTLGITVLYLLYDKFWPPRRTDNQQTGAEIQFELARDLKYLIYAFVITLIGFWAGVQMIHLVWYLVKSFTNG